MVHFLPPLEVVQRAKCKNQCILQKTHASFCCIQLGGGRHVQVLSYAVRFRTDFPAGIAVMSEFTT